MISIDIGKINTGFAILLNDDSKNLIIGLLNITDSKVNTTDESLKDDFENEIKKLKLKKTISVVIHRGLVLKTFFDIVFEKYEIEKVIIERQSQHNPTAQEIEYMITGICLNRTSDIIIFNPINKFSLVNIKYDTKNKAHKKLSVRIISNLLESDSNEDIKNFFNSLDKKDDIADAIYMAYIIDDKNNIQRIVNENFSELVTVS